MHPFWLALTSAGNCNPATNEGTTMEAIYGMQYARGSPRKTSEDIVRDRYNRANTSIVHA